MRRDIMKAAVTLFEQQGYDQTSIDEIAALAEVSQSTFFRYFPTKEDLLLGPDDALLEALLECVSSNYSRRADLAGVGEGFVEFAQRLDRSEDDLSRRQARLMSTSDSVLARAALGQLRWEHAVADRLAGLAGLTKPALREELLAATAMGAYSVAVRRFRKQRRDALGKLVAEAFAEAGGLIRPAAPAAASGRKSP